MDKEAAASKDTPAAAHALEKAFEEGGMNWGNVAIYSCPAACDSTTEEYVVVQDSVDTRPTRLQPAYMGDAYAVIPDDTTFGNDNDNDDGAYVDEEEMK